MLFQSVSLLLASATCLLASPFAQDHASPKSYVELHREPAAHSNGHLVYMGHAPGTEPKARSIQKRKYDCSKPSKTPTCSTSYGAQNDICDKLVTELWNDSQIKVAQDPRQICYEGEATKDDYKYCCVSWHDKVADVLTKGTLAPLANSILQTCTTDGVSGRRDNIILGAKCTSVCLSNRGTGC